MTAHQQKESELAHLENALQLLRFSSYLVSDKDGESPDFLIEIDGQEIGVEVTSVYRNLGNSNSAKTQSDLPVIVENAVKIYNRKGGIPLVFGFSFDGKSDVNSRTEFSQMLGDFLYEYISEHFPDGIRIIQEININLPSLSCSVFAQPTDQTTSVGFTVSGFDSKQINGVRHDILCYANAFVSEHGVTEHGVTEHGVTEHGVKSCNATFMNRMVRTTILSCDWTSPGSRVGT